MFIKDNEIFFVFRNKWEIRLYVYSDVNLRDWLLLVIIFGGKMEMVRFFDDFRELGKLVVRL